jgi:protein SCO1/2
MSDPAAPSPRPPDGSPTVRVLLWALLGLALVAAIGAGLWTRLAPEPPPPLEVIAEAPEFTLTAATGEAFSTADLAGRPYVVDFIFTRCVAACPVMTNRMATVGGDLAPGADFHRVSISVDPEYDTPEVLAAYAASRNIGPADGWVFLTGDTDAIYEIARDGFLLAVDPESGDPANPIAHSSRFVLVDGAGRIRGYYDAFEMDEVRQLDRDLSRLVDEAA